jgi:hypothetical protein
MPRRQRSRATCSARDELADQPLERVPAHDERVDRAQVVQHGCLRGAFAELDLRKPGPVARSPGALGVLVADVVAQQQLAHPVARPHQIAADVLAGAHQVAQRLLLRDRHPDRVQPADHQQTHEPLGVSLVGLDAVLRGALDLARRRDHTFDPGPVQRARQLKPRRPCLVGRADRSRQPSQERHHLPRCPRQPLHAQLTRLRVHHARHCLGDMHIQTGPGANLGHGRFLLLGCGRHASASRAATTSPIASGDRP